MELGNILEFRRDLYFEGAVQADWFYSKEKAAKVAYDMGMRTVDVFVKGLGAGRETAIRSLATVGLEVKTITDVTPIPHNGCRPPKRRRP